MIDRQRRRSVVCALRLRLCVFLAVLIGWPGLVAAGPARAGEWMDVLCQNPSGSTAPTDGLAFTGENTGVNVGAQGGVSCPGGLTGTVPAFEAGVGGVWARIVEDASGTPTVATWTYTAPAGSTIAGGSVTGVAAQQWTYLTGVVAFDAWISSPADQADAADVIADCSSAPGGFQSGGAACDIDPYANGAAWRPAAEASSAPPGLGGGSSAPVAAISHPGGTQLFLTAACSTPNTDACSYNQQAGDYVTMEAGFSWADILLSDNNQPTASGFGGSLLAPGTVHGTAHLTFTASDPAGPGVYTVVVRIDGGSPVYSGTPDTNGGRCSPVGTDPASGAMMFDYEQPCPASEQLDIPVDTTKLADGGHDLQVVVQDAAGNVATVLDQAFTTQNLTTVASTTSETPILPATPTGSTGGSGGAPTGPTSPSSPAGPPGPTAPTPAPTPAPAPVLYAFKLAPPTERLIGRVVHRRYLASEVVLTGAVVDPAGVAAPGIQVNAQVGSTTGAGLETVASTTTDAAGHFELKVSRGDSRRVQLVVDGQSVSFTQAVRPNVSLRIASLRGQRLIFTGRVAIDRNGGPAPVVELSDRTPSGWQALANIQVDKDGRYRYVYVASPLAVGRSFEIRASTAAGAFWEASSSRAVSAKVI